MRGKWKTQATEEELHQLEKERIARILGFILITLITLIMLFVLILAFMFIPELKNLILPAIEV